MPALAGNSDTELWDNAQELVGLNKDLRAGRDFVRPWPSHMFAIGSSEGSECAGAIDLRVPEAPVWWVDHYQLDGRGSGQTHETFDSWVDEYSRALRHDLEADGIDPDGTPEARKAAEDANARAGCRTLLTLLLIGCAIAGAVVAVALWLT